jgi:hypothetical protein
MGCAALDEEGIAGPLFEAGFGATGLRCWTPVEGRNAWDCRDTTIKNEHLRMQGRLCG